MQGCKKKQSLRKKCFGWKKKPHQVGKKLEKNNPLGRDMTVEKKTLRAKTKPTYASELKRSRTEFIKEKQARSQMHTGHNATRLLPTEPAQLICPKSHMLAQNDKCTFDSRRAILTAGTVSDPSPHYSTLRVVTSISSPHEGVALLAILHGIWL